MDWSSQQHKAGEHTREQRRLNVATCGHENGWETVETICEAVQKARDLKPDLILLDIGLPKLNGIEAAHRLLQFVPAAKVLFISQNNDADVIAAALSDGAKGYVWKESANADLLPAIEAVLRGDRFLSSQLAR